MNKTEICCETCINNVEIPPPHTCDICTSLDEMDFCMWEADEEVMKKRTTNIKVLYEPRAIYGISIQCPECNGWFEGDHILDDLIELEEEIIGSNCTCPRCSCEFKVKEESNIQEVKDVKELEKECLKKKVVWE